MTLGELIERLRTLPPETELRFDTGEFPGVLDSARGTYAHLSLDRQWPHSTYAEALATIAERANGATFHGYKGGDFTMNLYTPVWADNYGQWEGRAITEITDDGVIHTWVIPWEYR